MMSYDHQITINSRKKNCREFVQEPSITKVSHMLNILYAHQHFLNEYIAIIFGLIMQIAKIDAYQ